MRFAVLKVCDFLVFRVNRRSSEIQGTALGKSLRAWTCIYRSMLAGVAQPSLMSPMVSVDVKHHVYLRVTQSMHAFVGGTVTTWGR